MEKEFVRDRPTSIAQRRDEQAPPHPAAAPSPKFDVGS
jgi:hypothetical protein